MEKFLHKAARDIWVSVPDESSAYTIFETMNDRGLALSATDLIKNYLFGRAGEDKLSTVKHNWSQMMGILDTVSESEIAKTFIRHYCCAKLNNRVTRFPHGCNYNGSTCRHRYLVITTSANYLPFYRSQTLWSSTGNEARKI